MTKNKKLLPKLDKLVGETQKPRIMLVDDDEIDRQIFTAVLEDLRPNTEIGTKIF